MTENITPQKFQEMKDKNEKIAVLTGYDYPTAKILDKAEIDAVLVGDSLGNTVLGYENTLPVTMEEMLHHTRAVSRAIDNPLLIGDMPFISFQKSAEEAVQNAGRFVKEAGAEAVKVEGGKESIKQTQKIVEAGIPVMGHLGLTPQRILQFGSYRPQGKTAKEAQRILEDAQMLEDSGVFSIVLESIPQELAKTITEKLDIPTIGIGAGAHCDGQVLVLHDILGLSDFSPGFVKQYEDLDSSIEKAIENFKKDVKSGEFPTSKESYEMDKKELSKFTDILKE